MNHSRSFRMESIIVFERGLTGEKEARPIRTSERFKQGSILYFF